MMASVLAPKWSVIIVVLPSTRQHSGFWRSSAPGEKQSAHVSRVPQDSGAFHRFGPLGAMRHRPGLFQRRRRLGFQIELGPWVLDFSGHGRLFVLRSMFRVRSRLAIAPAGGPRMKWIAGQHPGLGMA